MDIPHSHVALRDVTFIEGGTVQPSIPPWVDFFLRLGFFFPSSDPSSRQIALVSMPCDSAGFGLVALGALASDLADESATDKDLHFANLLTLAGTPTIADRQQDPFAADQGTILRRVGEPGRAYKLVKKQIGNDELLFWETPGKGKNGPISGMITRDNAREFYRRGDYAQIASERGDPLRAQDICEIVGSSCLLERNCVESYGGLCVATRAAGSVASKRILETIRFSLSGSEVSLAELITVSSWQSRSSVSRCQVYNSRTKTLDKAITPRLIIADGDAALFSTLDDELLRHANVIAVLDRCSDRNQLEAVATKLESLRQWYDQDAELTATLPQAPAGTELLCLRRRH